MSEYEQYLSPFSWRYASKEMRQLWSEFEKRRMWRQIWIALAEAEMEFGLVQPEQVTSLRLHAEDVDIPGALLFESEINHDLMAELRVYGAQAASARPILHLGATSMDIEDNADALRMRRGLSMILEKLRILLLEFAVKIDGYADLPIMAFTHLQPAEPSTLGYRLATYAQDLFEDYAALENILPNIRGKGFKGAVGTGASYAELIGTANLEKLETRLSELLELPFYPVSNQTYPRKQDYTVISALAGVGASLYKFAFDLRLMQSPPIGEWNEPFGDRQVGSSAMPFKRNPVTSERIDSLARQLSFLPQLAWHNAAHSLLERTLDDSANRRSLLPESFLIVDEILKSTHNVLHGMKVNRPAIERNLAAYAPFASTERILMAMVKAGADRQEIHASLRDHAMNAWRSVQVGQPNPLIRLITSDPVFTQKIPEEALEDLFNVKAYVGIAPQAARQMAERIRQKFGSQAEG